VILTILVKGGDNVIKADLVDKVAEKSGLTKKDSLKAIDAVFEAITGALVAGDKVQLVGFGTFETKEREARKGINPRTREEIDIPAKRVPTFRAGRVLRDAVEKA
jgi:DNA-binding protein HU-beta